MVSGPAASFGASTGTSDESANDGHRAGLAADERGTAVAVAQPDGPVIADVTTVVTFTTWVGER